MGQEYPKYHVTDEGKVFVVNDDGSTTEYGRIVPEKKKAKRPRKPIPSFVLWIVSIVLLVGVAYCVAFRYKIEFVFVYRGDYFTTDLIVDSLEPLSWFCIALMLLVLILLGCVIRLNNEMRAIKEQ